MTRSARSFIVALTALSVAACFHTAGAAPAVEKPAAGAFPHELLSEVLGKYVNDAGKVDYKSLAGDRATLDKYVGFVAATSPKKDPALFPTHQDQEAYWLNAYNALAITGVIDRPGIKSVQDNLTDFFYLTKYVIGGKKVSLYTLENKVVRPTFADPRVHFALNCQSAGCPRLPQKAYDPKNLDAELDGYAKEFCTNPAKVNVDAAGTVHMSQIFEWYGKDFEAAGGQIAFCNAHGATLPAAGKLEFIPYDWALSAQEGRGP